MSDQWRQSFQLKGGSLVKPSEAEVLDLITTYGPITGRVLLEMSSYCRRTISFAIRRLAELGLVVRRTYLHDPRQYLYSARNEGRAS